MSLKLGNTNIAGTQVLYSTTGNNTDGAMTQAVTTTELNLKANDSNVVHKTGNETISGNKLFENTIRTKGGLDVINESVIKGTIPSATKYWGLFRANDANYTENWQNTRLGIGELSLNTVGDVELILGVYKNEASSRENSLISIKFNANGTKYVTAPASDVNNSIVTTVAKSKTQNGYFKLGNGLIIQFGLVTNMSNNKANVNFPIPFTAIPQVVTTSDKDGVNDGYNSYVSGISTTGFNAFNKEYGTNVNCWVHWIAVGY